MKKMQYTAAGSDIPALIRVGLHGVQFPALVSPHSLSSEGLDLSRQHRIHPLMPGNPPPHFSVQDGRRPPEPETEVKK
ncbi:MAG TPA: hypothetical protein VE134_02340 [Methanomicrobiales archaeon]|nr:hypothetical protein [Methanomicrobiales archaeon]